MTVMRASTIATRTISNDRAIEGSCLGRCRWKAEPDECRAPFPSTGQEDPRQVASRETTQGLIWAST